MKGEEGEQFDAGRMGDYTITKDPTRDAGLRVLMGPFSIYNKDNIDKAVGGRDAARSRLRRCKARRRAKALNMVLLPKFLGNAVFDQAHEGAEEAAKELGNTEQAAITSGRRRRTAWPGRSRS